MMAGSTSAAGVRASRLVMSGPVVGVGAGVAVDVGTAVGIGEGSGSAVGWKTGAAAVGTAVAVPDELAHILEWPADYDTIPAEAGEVTRRLS